LGRKSWLFAGSERGADRAAIMATLMTAKLNGIDPQAWLADALATHQRSCCPQARGTLAMELASEMERRKLTA
jgi:transposase